MRRRPKVHVRRMCALRSAHDQGVVHDAADIGTQLRQGRIHGDRERVSRGARREIATGGLRRRHHIRLLTDATTGKSIATRRGLGKTRHIALHLLRVQQRVQNGEIEVLKVSTQSNAADLFTKHHAAPRLHFLMERMGVELIKRKKDTV